MRDSIVIIGGYGHVGLKISTKLAQLYPGKVFAAGRSLQRAEAVSRESKGRILPMQIDVHKEPDAEKLSRVKVVVMCLDQQNTLFVQAIVRQGIHYIDISADYSFLSKVEQLHTTAAANHATAVLSVGLAPGLTNLLALYAKRLLDATDVIHISIMLGLGDSHGKAALEWTVDNLRSNFSTWEQGKKVERISFSDGRTTDFGSDLGARTAYRFNFADQHIIPRTLQTASVSTRLCFDHAFITKTAAVLKKLGAYRVLNNEQIRSFAVRALSLATIGKPVFAIKVDAIGNKDGKAAVAESFLHGMHEADATATVAAIVAQELYSSEPSSGVYHIEELFAFEQFEEGLRGTAAMSERLTIVH